MIAVSVSQSDLLRVRALLEDVKGGADNALAGSLNDAGNRAKTLGSAEIRKDLRLTAAYLRERIEAPKDKASNRATYSNLVAKVTSPSRGLVLSHFLTGSATQAIGGRYEDDAAIKVKVKPSGAAKTITGGFLLRLRRGTQSGDQVGIFVRNSGVLEHLYGPSVSQAFSSERDTISPALSIYQAERMDARVADILRRHDAGLI